MNKRILALLTAALLASLACGLGFTQAQSAPGAAPSEVPTGTRFLVRLRENISTQNAKAGMRFTARTLETLVAADGTVLPPGARVRGHVDKVEPAHKAGRARIWLTFDDVKTANGWAPLVADVVDIPGVHSLKVDYQREGEIEARSSNHQEEAEAAAAGALVGASAGVADHNGKDAAAGAATGAASSFMLASGLGQELVLEKDMKLELVLGRSLYLKGM